jgi:hypothetical protein
MVDVEGCGLICRRHQISPISNVTYGGVRAKVLRTAFGYVDPELGAENIAHSAMYTYKGGEQNVGPQLRKCFGSQKDASFGVVAPHGVNPMARLPTGIYVRHDNYWHHRTFVGVLVAHPRTSRYHQITY